jgi:hypothetical protein
LLKKLKEIHPILALICNLRFIGEFFILDQLNRENSENICSFDFGAFIDVTVFIFEINKEFKLLVSKFP